LPDASIFWLGVESKLRINKHQILDELQPFIREKSRKDDKLDAGHLAGLYSACQIRKELL
jgi:hypothetical protein